MKQYICLVMCRRDTYDRHWIKSNSGEDISAFRQRMSKCWGGNLDWQYEIYEVSSIN